MNFVQNLLHEGQVVISGKVNSTPKLKLMVLYVLQSQVSPHIDDCDIIEKIGTVFFRRVKMYKSAMQNNKIFIAKNDEISII